MRIKIIFILLSALAFAECSVAQRRALTFEAAKAQGVSMTLLDSLYQNAVDVNKDNAVFKSEKEQQKMAKCYQNLLTDFGKFLTKNNFHWDKPTKCFNRIYFNEDGSIDYFLYNFTTNNTNPEQQLSTATKQEFDRLLNYFILEYKIPLTAKVKFAQCSPATYLPAE